MSCFIQLIDLSLYFNQKICFEAFNYRIHAGERIALVGDNGSGKSSLLKIIAKQMAPCDGQIKYTPNVSIAYVPQLLEQTDILSGAEQFNFTLTQALAQAPDVLILDEPTNHLDQKNRQSLMRHLDQFTRTLIIASHDVNLLKRYELTFWHFRKQAISIFQGNFIHLNQQQQHEAQQLKKELSQLNQQKAQNHQLLMNEQRRAKKSRQKGAKSLQQAKWPTIVSKTKMLNAQESSGKKKKALAEHKEHLNHRLRELAHSEEIIPSFRLPTGESNHKAILTINDGSIAYDNKLIANKINLNMDSYAQLALLGANGSGKTSLLKAIMSEPTIYKQGEWIVPPPHHIGYLDQHYHPLTRYETVLESIQFVRADWSYADIRLHLNDFLFRSNEQVYAPICHLSGGERARLSLALIAAKPPKLLILDEITNNLDLKTRTHVLTLLKDYPGPFIIVSHDEDFLCQLNISHSYSL